MLYIYKCLTRGPHFPRALQIIGPTDGASGCSFEGSDPHLGAAGDRQSKATRGLCEGAGVSPRRSQPSHFFFFHFFCLTYPSHVVSLKSCPQLNESLYLEWGAAVEALQSSSRSLVLPFVAYYILRHMTMSDVRRSKGGAAAVDKQSSPEALEGTHHVRLPHQSRPGSVSGRPARRRC